MYGIKNNITTNEKSKNVSSVSYALEDKRPMDSDSAAGKSQRTALLRKPFLH
jgi:hypothetical protein